MKLKFTSVVHSITDKGGDPASGFFPGKYSDVADRFRVFNSEVSSSAERRNVITRVHLFWFDKQIHVTANP